MILSMLSKKNQIYQYIIRVNKKIKWKEKTNWEISKIIKRIIWNYSRISIILFKDINSNGKDSINKL